MAFSSAACFKMLPWTRFSTGLRKLKGDSPGRFCIECGMRDGGGVRAGTDRDIRRERRGVLMGDHHGDSKGLSKMSWLWKD